MRTKNTNYLWAILFVVIAVTMCAIVFVLVRTRNPYLTLSDALDFAKSNRSELLKVLEHYGADPADSLKLKAAEFLITNMISKRENSRLLINKTGKKLPDLLDFTDVAEYNAEINHLIATKQASIDSSIKNDLETITSDYLIRQIELAFKAWGKPWSKNISFEDFCNYILPYRAANEPLSEMREVLYDRYMPILDTLPGLIDPLEVCRRINEVLRDRFEA